MNSSENSDHQQCSVVAYTCNNSVYICHVFRVRLGMPSDDFVLVEAFPLSPMLSSLCRRVITRRTRLLVYMVAIYVVFRRD